MKTLLKVVGGLIGLVVVIVAGLVTFVFLSLRPNLPDTEFTLRAPDTTGVMNVLVVGATGKLGLEIVQDLVEQGDKVTAFVRETSDRSQLEPLGVDFAVGDVMEPATIVAAFKSGEFDAAIVTIAGFDNPELDYLGNANVADAAKAAGVQRFIMISTVGAGDSYEAAPLVSRIMLSDVMPHKTRAEDHIRDLGLDYTIVRPGGLPFGIVPTGNGLLSEDPTTMGFIKRPDLARLIVGVLYDDAAIGKTLAAVDPTLTSPFDGKDPE